MNEQERGKLDLDEILREFGEDPEPTPGEESAEPDETLAETRRIDLTEFPAEPPAVPGDTIRLDSLREEIAGLIKKDAPEEEDKIWSPAEAERDEPFSEQWEPEYEQPMGEYIPPKPIQFQPRSRLHELKKKLIDGPERRYYQLSERGVGKLQAAIFLSLLVALVCAASTAMYSMGMVQENRLRLMVFVQFLTLLLSALLGSYQLMEGITDLFKKRFTLNTLLTVTFLFCLVDGIFCLRQVRVPCCAAFSLEVTMSLWGAYQRRSCELSQTDTMRKASRLDGLTVCPDYLGGKKALLKTEGQVEDFMDHYAAPGKPERLLNLYGMIAMFAAIAIGIAAGILHGLTAGAAAGVSTGVQVCAVCLLAAMPASAFICQSRPAWILERRLHRIGTVLCGWQGVEAVSGKVFFPLTYQDLLPADAIRLNGMKFFGKYEPDHVIACTAALLNAEGSGLSGLFSHLLDTYNGKHYDAHGLSHYPGGIGGTVAGQPVLLGSMSFLKEMDVAVPDNARVGYGVYVAIDGELVGLFAVNYEKTRSAADGLSTLSAYRWLQCVVVSDDFMLTRGFLQSKFGVKAKRFLFPEHDVRGQLREKQAAEIPAALLITRPTGLAPIAFGVTGGRALKRACNIGTILHMIGGILGLSIMLLLVILGALQLLTPANMFLFQLVWMLPALLVTEWTRSV